MSLDKTKQNDLFCHFIIRKKQKIIWSEGKDMERRQTMNVGKVRQKFDTLLQYYKKKEKNAI